MKRTHRRSPRSPRHDAEPRAAASHDVCVCPHCWEVNRQAARLCGRCGADMSLTLQESGGLRHTAPVQSPVPVTARLSAFQRAVLLAFVVLLALVHLLAALHHAALQPVTRLPQPLGSGSLPTAPAQR